MQETRGTGSVPGRENHLEEKMATHSSVLAWRIPGTERLQSCSSRLGVGGNEASGISGVEQVGFLLSSKAVQILRDLEDLGEG